MDIRAFTYQPSGKFSPFCVVYLTASLFFAFFLSFPYVFLVFWNPFVYLSFLINIGYGIVLGAALYHSLRRGKVRNNAIALLFAAILATVAVYGVWVWYVYIKSNYNLFTFSLKEMAIVAALVAEKGPWKISGTVIAGWPVYLAWLFEAGLIALVIYVGSAAHKSDGVYCEQCGSWAIKLPSVKSLSFLEGSNVSKEAIARTRGEPLLMLEKTTLPSADSIELELFNCPKNEHQLFYISIQSKIKGNKFTLTHLKVSETLFTKIRSKFVPA